MKDDWYWYRDTFEADIDDELAEMEFLTPHLWPSYQSFMGQWQSAPPAPNVVFENLPPPINNPVPVLKVESPTFSSNGPYGVSSTVGPNGSFSVSASNNPAVSSSDVGDVSSVALSLGGLWGMAQDGVQKEMLSASQNLFRTSNFLNGTGGKTIDRSQFAEELKNPDVLRAFAGRMRTEVGGQGSTAQIAFAETIFNRAQARNQTLMQTLSGHYFPTVHPERSDDPRLLQVVNYVFQNGTNITRGATGNASGSVGFGGGPETFAANGEKFGVEAADRNWQPLYAVNKSHYGHLKSDPRLANQDLVGVVRFHSRDPERPSVST